MANDNHETYNGNDISTYTDTIDEDNTFTVADIEACVLSAGVVPYSDPRIFPLGNYNQGDCTGHNIYTPFAKEADPSMILWIDESSMQQAEATNHYWYKHIVYVSANAADNFVATDLTIANYKNFLTILSSAFVIDGQTYTLYAPSIETKYGEEGNWTSSVLSPMFLLTAGGTVAVSQKLNTLLPQSSWTWNWGVGDVSNTLDVIGGGFGDQRNLLDGSEISIGDCLWEALDEEPYAISEAPAPNPTFPRVHQGDHFTHVYNGGNPLGLRYGYNNIEDILMEAAFCGLKFEYNGVTYKPLAENGVVYGYTDDMSQTSEWDNWEHIGDHDIPITPPTPPIPPGYDDDPWHGATFAGTSVGGAGAFAKVYYMDATELANLRSWMNSINVPEGFDPMQQIIGLSQVPVALSGSSPENVVFVNSSAVYDPGVTTRAVDTGVATQQSMGTPISYYLGSVDIVRRMQQRGEPYLDYDCQIELYLPLIGMFSLDTQAVMGRTISAYAILDPVSGTLAAYAYVTKDGQNLPVAYGSTTIGVDLPVSAQQLSVSRAALKQANAQLGTSLLSSALSLVAMTTAGGAAGAGAKTSMGSSGLSAAGIREAGSDYMKASQVGNVFGDFMNWGRTIRQLSYGNNTAISGSFGGSAAQWSYPFTPYVKIIRPRYEKPSNYAHSQGVPCVQKKRIGNCTGFIQCINPDVSGITGATDLELQAIQAALSNGIFAGGGS